MFLVCLPSSCSTKLNMLWFLLILVCICQHTSCFLFKVKLSAIQSQRAVLAEQGKWASYVSKRNKTVKFSEQHMHLIPEKDYSDILYVAEVIIGGQTFRVVLDTGSSNLWVPNNPCGPQTSCQGNCSFLAAVSGQPCTVMCPTRCCVTEASLNSSVNSSVVNPCAGKRLFDDTKSSAYSTRGQRFDMKYVTGSCSGFLGEDSITFDGVTVFRSQFGQVGSMADLFADKPFDGILGLGWPPLAVDNIMPVVSEMVGQNLLDSNVFAFYRTRMSNRAENDGEFAGEFALGGYDSTRFTEPITWVPLTRRVYWEFNISYIVIDEERFGQANSVAISDTGTSFIHGPAEVINAIVQKLGATYDAANDTYVIRCDGVLPDVAITIQNRTFPISSQDYRIQQNGYCCVTFDKVDPFAGVQWILGDTFVRAYYTIYDIERSRVGLASAIQNVKQ